ncbi:hypothetical protein TrispH2_009635 [Trichoplax sp. H2]|nr:hypothetical protein TrispH2_009635 [Trichoplax sp. H2]|eukprot:RDD38245.1 hypothetical protein TrispH2_009635 [Trichoplax sp. H2]
MVGIKQVQTSASTTLVYRSNTILPWVKDDLKAKLSDGHKPKPAAMIDSGRLGFLLNKIGRVKPCWGTMAFCHVIVDHNDDWIEPCQ